MLIPLFSLSGWSKTNLYTLISDFSTNILCFKTEQITKSTKKDSKTLI